MILLTPKKYGTLNCIENSIANICDAYAINFCPLFIFSWDFGYDSTKLTIGEKLHYHNDYMLGLENYFAISKDYLGLVFIETVSMFDEYEENSNMIYMVNVDSYDCSWNSAYHRYHYPHYFLIKKDGEGETVAIDSFSTLNMPIITVDLLEKNKTIYSVSFKNRKRSFEDIKDLYHEIIKANYHNDVFRGIQAFADDLEKIDNIEFLSPQIDDVSNSYIVRRLSYIANSRYNSSLLFRYLNYDICVIKGMEDIFSLWTSIKNLFVKILLSRNSILFNRAYQMIINVAEKEELLAVDILRRANNDTN